MGVRKKIIPGMLAHNGTEPDLIAGELPLYGSTVEGTEVIVIPGECKRLVEVVGFHRRRRCLGGQAERIFQTSV